MSSEGSILSVLPALDVVALAWFLLLWAGYNLAVDRILRRPVGLNQHMHLVRHSWMGALLKRDNRVIDALLMGHLIHSVSFFASTAMLALAVLSWFVHPLLFIGVSTGVALILIRRQLRSRTVRAVRAFNEFNRDG